MLEFRILGPLEVVAESGAIELGGPKQRATLAILLLSANRVVSVDRLADDLYSGDAPVTAVTQVQQQVSELRKALGSREAIETRAPGYLVRLAPEQLDLTLFERRASEGARAFERGEPERAAALLREALALWRGAPLADLAHEPFAQRAFRRLEEIRLSALEQRLDAELALGRHRELVAELHELAADEPLRERVCAQLMLALYRAGRQAEALDVYRRTRERLAEDLGIEPTPALRELERAILTHDPSLQPAARFREPARSVLVLADDDARLPILLPIAERLTTAPERELIVARFVRDERELDRTGAFGRVPTGARAAALATHDPVGHAVRLATAYDVELVLVAAPDGIPLELPGDLGALFERSPAHVAILTGSPGAGGRGIAVPFIGGEHDWAALELAARFAAAISEPLWLVGTKADPRRRADADRLLAHAALAVKRVAGIEAEPVLAGPGEEGLVAAVEPAGLVVAGLSARWRREGLGAARGALVRAGLPVLLVHRGPRPGALAPRDTRTRFTWSLEGT